MINSIINIELSAFCNNNCKYCPAPNQAKSRPVGLMEMPTFERTIEHVNVLIDRGKQKPQVNLFGIGEPFLNPRIIEMTSYARRALPYQVKVHTNTNGKIPARNLGILDQMLDAGIDSIDVTVHPESYEQAMLTVRRLRELRIPGTVSIDPVLSPNNWAGQVDWPAANYCYPCQWLRDGDVMVMWDGRVTACCLDAQGLGVIGHITDADILERTVKTFALCTNCHQEVPANG